MEIDDVGRIHEYIRQKQRLEIDLADELLGVFNDPAIGLLDELRRLVALALGEINAVRLGASSRIAFGAQWVKSWQKYAGAQGFILGARDWDAHYIDDRVRTMTAQHCADWIRIYGEIVEEILHGNEDAQRKSYQLLTPEGFWDKGKGGLRQRIPASKGPARHAAYAAAQTPAWQDASGRASAGIARWDVDVDSDTTGRMDQVFGLMPGATISGTTTDNIYFLDKFSRMHLDPIYYLLPVAAIVAGGHHSLLEVGLPLTLNHVVDYKVGLYSTLYPKRVTHAGEPEGARVIKGVLKTFEDMPNNHLMLVYYHGVGQPQGCFLYDRESDLKSWEVIARADERLLRKFKEIKTAWPHRMQVLGLSWMGNEKTDKTGTTRLGL